MTLTGLEFATKLIKTSVQDMISALRKVETICEGLPDGESTFNRWRSMIEDLERALPSLTEFLEQHHDELLESVNRLLNTADVITLAEKHCQQIPY